MFELSVAIPRKPARRNIMNAQVFGFWFGDLGLCSVRIRCAEIRIRMSGIIFVI